MREHGGPRRHVRARFRRPGRAASRDRGADSRRYYALAARKVSAAAVLKPWVTRVQIAQFALSFGLVAATCSGAFGRACAGYEAMLANVAFNAVLFVLFFGVLRAGRAKRKGS